MNNIYKIFCLLLVCLSAIGSAKATNHEAFAWYNGEPTIYYTISKKVSPVVATALDMLSEDIHDATGTELRKDAKANINILQLDKDKNAQKRLATAGVPIEKLNGKIWFFR